MNLCHGQSALPADPSLTVPKPLKENRFRIPKSRYSSVSLYISDHWMHRQEYDDIEAPYDQAIFERLQKHGKFSDSTTADVNARRPDKRRYIGQVLIAYSRSISPTYSSGTPSSSSPRLSIKTTRTAMTISRCGVMLNSTHRLL